VSEAKRTRKPKSKPKLLIHSNAPHTGTGYGQQTALFAERLAETYDVGISAFYGVEGSVIQYKGIPVYPGMGQTHGNETILDHARIHFDGDLRGGLVLTLMDVWVLDPFIWRQLNVAMWTPIDHEPCPPPIAAVLRESNAVPIAMSKFGEAQLQAAGLDALYVPHAIDTSIFKPSKKALARTAMNIPKEGFLVGMVAANRGNPGRKMIPEALEAFKTLRDEHSDAMLYLHMEMSGRFDGVNVVDYINRIGLDREAVTFCDQYRVIHYPWPPERMAGIFNAFDVLLMPSGGEGFGIPAVEAAACGVPAITSDYSAQPELNPAGWLVSGQHNYTRLKAWQFTPNIEDIADALRQAYELGDTAVDQYGGKCVEFAQVYDIDRVLDEQMLPALAAAQKRFTERKPERLKA
jgi:glycosyltransferase involved in cell wall biosynthesis